MTQEPVFKKTMDAMALDRTPPFSHVLNRAIRNLLAKTNAGDIKPAKMTEDFLFYCALYVHNIKATSHLEPQLRSSSDPAMNWVKQLLLHIANKYAMDTKRLVEVTETVKEVEKH